MFIHRLVHSLKTPSESFSPRLRQSSCPLLLKRSTFNPTKCTLTYDALHSCTVSCTINGFYDNLYPTLFTSRFFSPPSFLPSRYPTSVHPSVYPFFLSLSLLFPLILFVSSFHQLQKLPRNWKGRESPDNVLTLCRSPDLFLRFLRLAITRNQDKRTRVRMPTSLWLRAF